MPPFVNLWLILEAARNFERAVRKDIEKVNVRHVGFVISTLQPAENRFRLFGFVNKCVFQNQHTRKLLNDTNFLVSNTKRRLVTDYQVSISRNVKVHT